MMCCQRNDDESQQERDVSGCVPGDILDVEKQPNLDTENGQARCWALLQNLDPNLIVGGPALEDLGGESVDRLYE